MVIKSARVPLMALQVEPEGLLVGPEDPEPLVVVKSALVPHGAPRVEPEGPLVWPKWKTADWHRARHRNFRPVGFRLTANILDSDEGNRNPK